MKKILIVFLLMITLVGCSQNKNDSKKSKLTEKIDYKEIIKEGNYLIIDVRTKEEYEESHITGAINIPYDEINESSNIPKDNKIFVYCRSGVRSAKAYDTLKKLNYDVYDLGTFNDIDLPKD